MTRENRPDFTTGSPWDSMTKDQRLKAVIAARIKGETFLAISERLGCTRNAIAGCVNRNVRVINAAIAAAKGQKPTAEPEAKPAPDYDSQNLRARSKATGGERAAKYAAVAERLPKKTTSIADILRAHPAPPPPAPPKTLGDELEASPFAGKSTRGRRATAAPPPPRAAAPPRLEPTPETLAELRGVPLGPIPEVLPQLRAAPPPPPPAMVPAKVKAKPLPQLEPPKPKPAMPRPVPVPGAARKRKTDNDLAREIMATMAQAVKPPLATIAPNPMPAAIGKVALQDHKAGCRYPLWSSDFSVPMPPAAELFYCGEPVSPDAVYCSVHYRVCYTAAFHPKTGDRRRRQ